MTDIFSDHFSIVYDICRAACHGDTALGRSSVKKLAALIESSTPDDAALLKRLTKKAAKNPAHFVQSDEGGSKPAPSVEQDERGALIRAFDASLSGVPRYVIDRFGVEHVADGGGWIKESDLFDRFAASTSANVAQGAVAVGLVMTNDKGEKYGALLDSNIEERTKLYVAPPAQTALTDDARECLLDVTTHFDNLRAGLCAQRSEATNSDDGDGIAYWNREIRVLERMKAQAERALTAAQSASGDTK